MPTPPSRPRKRGLRTRSSRVSATRSSALDSAARFGQVKAMNEAADGQELSFEAALARLEEIVRTLERGEAPLDQSIDLYQEGDRLKRLCEERLKSAQARIE